MKKFELRKQFTIEAARYLPHLNENHPCKQMHGHSFKIILVLVGELKPHTEWVMDYHDINQIVNPILKTLDHHVLNQVEGLENPTTEKLTQWIYNQVKSKLSCLTQVIVSETSDTQCRYPLN